MKFDGQEERSLPRPALRTISNRTALRNQDGLRKDAQIRRASHMSQKENLDPKGLKVRNNKQGTQGRHSSSAQRRTFSDMHAKVGETYDGSYLSDERPPSVITTSKNTRFGNTKAQKQGLDIARAVSNAAGRPHDNSNGNNDNTVDSAEAKQVEATDTINSLRENTNHESFILPDMPNLSELVSGIYQEEVPVRPRQNRSRTTRFASPPAVTMSEPHSTHVPLDAIPIPEDEKAIFASLKLLQEKVSTLEKENLKAERRLGELQEENQLLRADKSTRRTSEDRKVRMYKTAEEESGRGAATLAVERNSKLGDCYYYEIEN